ncbi:SDR family oxidoreductase [Croceicoccus sp. F390]|uniref:SDR family oxidoreductase n=1 Tax=Croceicoccus esteveae TaxID=3075597 RepID=A0ABU2ZJ99_9SPHN|nr:SDR family oxidoreductase [Croceicoccus sp. F390]MDT0576685.1 SDR family oxidoreductase [Croceicoccus sp. F390]
MKERRPVIVVTGASAGVGRAVVRRFAQDGAAIGLIARGHDGLQGAADDVTAAGGTPLILPLDVADAAAVDDAAAQVEREFGPIDIWVNAAFAGVLSRFLDMDLEDYRRVTNVTYHGQVHGTMAALKRMVPRNSGSVVLVGSALAYRGVPLQSAYCGAKHAIQGFHDSIRCELLSQQSRVHVSMVQLPAVNTPQFDWVRTNLPRKPKPASPPYQPELAAKAVHWAAHHRRKEVVVGLPAITSIIGDKVASSLLDHYLAMTGISGQQDNETAAPDRKDNLYEPVAGDHGAHGRFDASARTASPALSLTLHRKMAMLAGAAVAGAAGLIWRAQQRG